MHIKNFLRNNRKNPIFIGVVAVLVVFVASLLIRYGGSDEGGAGQESLQLVTITSASQVAGEQNISLIGTVRAFTEAQITTERAGRVTGVNAVLGEQVAAGQVIATLENASEQAAVLQAQGVYEAALASSQQSTVSVAEAETNLSSAKNNVINALRSAYSTTNAIVLNDIDEFYGNPDFSTPGLKLNGKGQTQFLNNERVAYRSILSEWNQRTNTLTQSSDLDAEVTYAKQNVNRTISLLDIFINLFAEQDATSNYSEADWKAYSSEFTALKGSLLQTLASIENAEASVSNAEDALERARTSSTGGTVSAADAQVKQALGSLRAAQANLAKTILRTPISGTVNSLNVRVGDFVSSFQAVSEVANNNALEIVTYVGDFEKEQLVEGDEVVIEGAYAGIITNIAPALDPTTRKTEVRIATESTEITNGDTVRITKNTNIQDYSSRVMIPITSIKFQAEDGYVFVVEDGKLTSRPVSVGSIEGTLVQVTEGLSATDEFVLDARGLTEGTEVEIKN